MKKTIVTAAIAAMTLFTVSHAHALVVCAKDDGTGQPKEKSKLVLKTTCTAGKEVPIGIAVTGTVGVDAKVEVYSSELSVSNGDIDLTGGNLQVKSGSGTTDGAINGKGNIIVGYNDAPSGELHTGSHNLIVGDRHQYTSYSGLVAGYQNTISGPAASVSGGTANVASGPSSSVSGGVQNTATNVDSWVGGGFFNAASGGHASVSGGSQNTASSLYSSVSGGSGNIASTVWSSVSGGEGNVASGQSSSVSGGYQNTASGTRSSVSGGSTLSAISTYEWHAGQSGGFPTGTQY